MGIIDVNLDRPAFKRMTGTEESEAESPSDGQEDTESTPGRGRTLLKTIGVLAIGFMGMVTVRKLRNRRDSGGDDRE